MEGPMRELLRKMLLVCLCCLIAIACSYSAFASEPTEPFEIVAMGGGPDYGDKDIRNSLGISYESSVINKDSQLFHARVAKDFQITFDNYNEPQKINIKKGDILLMFDRVEAKASGKVTIVINYGQLYDIDSNSLVKDQAGKIVKSKALPTNTKLYFDLTVIRDQFKASGKYLYEKPDFTSKKVGVFRKDTVLVSQPYSDHKTDKIKYLIIFLPEGDIGYLYVNYDWKDIALFVNEA